jgi:hypothetical protein
MNTVMTAITKKILHLLFIPICVAGMLFNTAFCAQISVPTPKERRLLLLDTREIRWSTDDELIIPYGNKEIKLPFHQTRVKERLDDYEFSPLEKSAHLDGNRRSYLEDALFAAARLKRKTDDYFGPGIWLIVEIERNEKKQWEISFLRNTYPDSCVYGSFFKQARSKDFWPEESHIMSKKISSEARLWCIFKSIPYENAALPESVKTPQVPKDSFKLQREYLYWMEKQTEKNLQELAGKNKLVVTLSALEKYSALFTEQIHTIDAISHEKADGVSTLTYTQKDFLKLYRETMKTFPVGARIPCIGDYGLGLGIGDCWPNDYNHRPVLYCIFNAYHGLNIRKSHYQIYLQIDENGRVVEIWPEYSTEGEKIEEIQMHGFFRLVELGYFDKVGKCGESLFSKGSVIPEKYMPQLKPFYKSEKDNTTRYVFFESSGRGGSHVIELYLDNATRTVVNYKDKSIFVD